MENKTNLSEEFSGSSNFASREFGTDHWKLDPKTDLSSELNRPRISDSSEFSVACSDKEFSYVSNEPVPPPKPSRTEQHRRSLLLQMASLGLSAVVVTNAMGMDILGDDMLFSDSPPKCIYVGEVVDESMNDDDPLLETTDYVIYSPDKSEVNPGPYGDSVWYDDASNTLYLDGCQLDILNISYLDEDVTIFVESTSHISLLQSIGVSITISGNQDASLIINQHSRVHWWYGIVMYGEGHDISLTVSPDAIVNVRGSSGAIAIDNTVANSAIRFDASQTFINGVPQSGAFPFESVLSVDGGAADWTIMDDNGAIATHVIFSPIGYKVPAQYALNQFNSMYGWGYEDESMYSGEHEGQSPSDYEEEVGEIWSNEPEKFQDFINEHPEIWGYIDEP